MKIRSIRDRRTVVLEEAGHWVHHDQLEAVVDVILDFLAEKSAPTGGRV